MKKRKLTGNAKALRDLGYALYEVAQGERELPSPAALAYLGIASALARQDDKQLGVDLATARSVLNLTDKLEAEIHEELEETLGIKFGPAKQTEPKRPKLALVKQPA